MAKGGLDHGAMKAVLEAVRQPASTPQQGVRGFLARAAGSRGQNVSGHSIGPFLSHGISRILGGADSLRTVQPAASNQAGLAGDDESPAAG